MESYLEGLKEEDRRVSERGGELLVGLKLTKFRWDSEREELFIEFENGRRLFVNHIKDKENVSIT